MAVFGGDKNCLARARSDESAASSAVRLDQARPEAISPGATMLLKARSWNHLNAKGRLETERELRGTVRTQPPVLRFLRSSVSGSKDEEPPLVQVPKHLVTCRIGAFSDHKTNGTALPGYPAAEATGRMHLEIRPVSARKSSTLAANYQILDSMRLAVNSLTTAHRRAKSASRQFAQVRLRQSEAS